MTLRRNGRTFLHKSDHPPARLAEAGFSLWGSMNTIPIAKTRQQSGGFKVRTTSVAHADGQTSFALVPTPRDPSSIVMWVNGLAHSAGSGDWAITGSDLTWANPYRIEATDVIFFTYN